MVPTDSVVEPAGGVMESAGARAVLESTGVVVQHNQPLEAGELVVVTPQEDLHLLKNKI